MFLTKYQQARIQSIKTQNTHSREMIAIIQKVLDQEWPKATFDNVGTHAPAMRMKLEQMEIDLVNHRRLLDENEALIAKLESPIWKIWKQF